MKFNFLGKGADKKGTSKSVAKKAAVKRAASGALIRYDKTFKDLARYDRGEQLSIRISR